MFGRGKRERERGRRIGAEAFPYLDQVLDHYMAIRAGTAPPQPETFGVVPVIERLIAICDGDRNAVMVVLKTWWEGYEEGGDSGRSIVASAVYVEIGLRGFGNLFGSIPPDAAAFDAELAAEGRRRGWRT